MEKKIKIFGLSVEFGDSIPNFEKIDELIVKTDKHVVATKKDFIEFSKVLNSMDGSAQILQFMKEFENRTKSTTVARRKLTAEERAAKKIANESERAETMQALAMQRRQGSIKQLEAEIAKLRIVYENLSRAERNTAQGQAMKSHLSGLRKEMRSLRMETGDFTNNIGNYMSGLWNKTTMMVAGMMGFVGTFKRFLSGLYSPFQDLEYRMAMVQAVSRATNEEAVKLEGNARRLGATTEYTATEVAGLQLAYARLGFVPDQIIKITGATLDLATATGENLEKSADVVGTTLKGFRLQADQTKRVVDVMTQSFNSSSLKLDFFAESMKYVAPLAVKANVSLEQTTAMLGVLADRGIRGSQAGTALRRIFLEIAKDGGSVSERLDELSKKGLSLGGAMDEVGKYAMTALSVLVDSKKDVDGLSESLENAEGAARKAAEGIRDTSKIDFDVLLSAVQEKLIAIGEWLSPFVRKTTQFLTWTITNLKTVTAWAGSYLIALKALQAAKTLYLVISGKVVLSETAFGKALQVNMLQLRSATTATKLFAAAKLLLTGNIRAASVAFKMFTRSLMSNPFGLVAVAIASLIAYFVKLRDQEEKTANIHSEYQAELAKEKDRLDTLKKAVEESEAGSRKRAEAIRLINENYGEYLPNLLTEKSSNEDVAKALQIVNTRLADNIALKYARQELEQIETNKAEAKKKILDLLIERYKEAHGVEEITIDQEKLLAASVRDTFEAIESGADPMESAIALLGQYGIRFESNWDAFVRFFSAGQGFYYDAVKKIQEDDVAVFEGFSSLIRKNASDAERIKALYGVNPATITIDPGTTPPPKSGGEDEKSKTKWSLSNDREHNAQLLELKRQLHSGEIASEQEYQNKVLELEIKTLSNRIKLNKEKGTDLLKLKQQLEDKQYQHTKNLLKQEEKYTENRRKSAEKVSESEFAEKEAQVAAMRDGIDKKMALNDLATQKKERSARKELDATLKQLEKEQEAYAKGSEQYETIEQEKARIKTAFEAKLTDITAAGAKDRLQILKSASNEELILLSGRKEYAAEVQQIINDKLAEQQQATNKSLLQAQGVYVAEMDLADQLHTKEKDRKAARLQAEIEVRQAKFKTYEAELKMLAQLGQFDSTRYKELIAELQRLQNELNNLGKGMNADGTGGSWMKHALGLDDDAIKQIRSAALDVARSISDAIAQVATQASQRRLSVEKDRIQEEYDAEVEKLESKRKRGVISEKKYQKEMAKLEKEKKKKDKEAEKKAFEEQKKISILQAIANTALAIINAFATMPWPAAPIAAATAAATGAIQVAVISSQKFYRRGGVIDPINERMGILRGPSHGHGGMPIYVGNQYVGEAEGDELFAIVNKRDTQTLGALSVLNARHGKKFAQGGTFTRSGVSAPVDYITATTDYVTQSQLVRAHTDMMKFVQKQTEAINRRIDRMRVYVVQSDIAEAGKEADKLRAQTTF